MQRSICSYVSDLIRVNPCPTPVLNLLCLFALMLLTGSSICFAQEGKVASSPSSTAGPAGWEFDLSGSYYFFRSQDDFTLAVLRADRGSLHLEARYNYEAIDSGSLFVGWTFSGGEELAWEVTPIIGAVFGQKEGVAPGFELSLGYGIVDFYSETEYVRDREVREDSFTYSWNELGISPLNWLRFGIVTQRTMVYQSERDIQRGGFVQGMYKKATLSAYVFNPDDGENRFAVFSLGAKF